MEYIEEAEKLVYRYMYGTPISKFRNVYLIQDVYNDLLKIGVSKDPLKRLKQLQIANGRHLKLLYVITDVPCGLEKDLHSVFEDDRTVGEWYINRGNIIDYFSKEGVKYE